MSLNSLHPRELLTLSRIRDNVAENIMAALNMDDESQMSSGGRNVIVFDNAKFHQEMNGELRQFTGAITVFQWDNGNFDVSVRRDDQSYGKGYHRLSGAKMEDLFIELADI